MVSSVLFQIVSASSLYTSACPQSGANCSTVCRRFSATFTILSLGTNATRRVFSFSANTFSSSFSPGVLRLLPMIPASRTEPREANRRMPLAMLLAAYRLMSSPEEMM